MGVATRRRITEYSIPFTVSVRYNSKGASIVTTYERYAILLVFLQLAVSGLGFIVVAWTLRVLVRSIDAQSSAGVAARQLEFDKVILTYPVLYKYFYQGQEINSDDAEFSQAMAATQLLANYFDGYFQQQGMYRQMWPDDKWESYIQDHVAKSPVLRSYVRENELWFSPKFVKMCRAVDAHTTN
jgi:hypothetical protein